MLFRESIFEETKLHFSSYYKVLAGFDNPSVYQLLSTTMSCGIKNFSLVNPKLFHAFVWNFNCVQNDDSNRKRF